MNQNFIFFPAQREGTKVQNYEDMRVAGDSTGCMELCGEEDLKICLSANCRFILFESDTNVQLNCRVEKRKKGIYEKVSTWVGAGFLGVTSCTQVSSSSDMIIMITCIT